jgi:hypothetical protein
MPVLQATQEAEIRKFKSSPGKKLVKSHLNKQSRHGSNHSYMGGIGRRIRVPGGSWAKIS